MILMRFISFIMLSILSLTCAAEDNERLWQVIDNMQKRIERLESELGIRENQAKTAQTEKTAEIIAGNAYARYWLSKNPAFDPGTEPPLREGSMTIEKSIPLNPAQYGYSSGGLFDEYYDPSLYPVAAVVIEGDLVVDAGGEYQLVIKPTPPREVGGSGNVEVSIEITINNRNVFTMPFSKSLAGRQQTVSLSAGRQSIAISILARSPGFGPSPVKTRVYIGLQAEGAITSYPISRYLQSGQ
jgi:hypothetical protein